MCTGTREVGSTVTTGGQDGLVTPESVQCSVLHVERDDTDTFAILHEKVEGKVFNEEVGVVSEGLTVKGVEDGVTGSIGSGGASIGLSTLSELEGLTTESSLVDLALLGSGEWDTEVLELRSTCQLLASLEMEVRVAHLNDGARCLPTHVVDSILVT